MIKISEIFYSIQGESTYAGLPCVMVRLNGCNLRCVWCDTRYSFDNPIELTKKDIIDKAESFNCKLIEFTGGEPLLQDEIYELFDYFLNKNYTVLLETNGSILLNKVNKNVAKIVDVKCPDSNEGNSFNIKNLEYIDKNNDEIKFVLASKNDYDWAKKFIDMHNLSGYKIILSVAGKLISPKNLAEWILEDKLNVRMQLQMHKYIWGFDSQGV